MVLKFLQKLASDFPYICLQFCLGNFYRQMYRKFLNKVLGLLAHVMPSIFFSRICKSEAFQFTVQNFPYICLQFCPGKFYRQMYKIFLNKVLGLLAHVMPSNFFSRIHKSEAFQFTVHIFFKTAVLRNYLTLDSHTNTVISQGFAYSSRWRRKL